MLFETFFWGYEIGDKLIGIYTGSYIRRSAGYSAEMDNGGTVTSMTSPNGRGGWINKRIRK